MKKSSPLISKTWPPDLQSVPSNKLPFNENVILEEYTDFKLKIVLGFIEKIGKKNTYIIRSMLIEWLFREL